jgi:tetratricopeptide (TPR) repeat protein
VTSLRRSRRWTAVGVAPFVGRERELGDLQTLLSGALASRGAFVALTGAAGIGKTRLADEVAGITSDSFHLVSATCGPPGGTPPFWPWTQVVRDLLASDEKLATRASAEWPRTAALAPGAAGGPSMPTRHVGELARAELFEEVVSLLAAGAAERPLMVVVDDLHDADSSSLLLIAHVARRIRSLPIALVATWRTGDTRRPEEPGAEVLRQATVVAVPPLGVSQMAALAEAVTGEALPPAMVEAVHRRTSGNPLLAHELLARLEPDGHDGPTPATIPTLVPDSMRRAVAARLAALSPEERGLVSTASVLGTTFPLDVLAESAGVDIGVVLDDLGGAETAGLLGSLGSSSGAFTHEIIRDAVYEALAPSARARLHGDAADTLVRLRTKGRRVEAVELARHYLAAGPGRSEAAATYAREAGDRAMALLAYEDAVRLYEQALAASGTAGDGGEARAELLVRLADARGAGGDRPGARGAYLEAADEARQMERPDLVATAALGLGEWSGFEVALLDRPQIALLEEALRKLPQDDLVLRSSVMARLSVAASFMESEAWRLELSGKAVALARQGGDDGSLALALAARCDAMAGPDHSEDRGALAAEIVELAGRLRDPQLELLGRRLAVVALLECGDVAAADREVQAFAATSAALHRPLYAWYVPLWRAMRALMRGRIDECRAFLDEAEQVGGRAGSDNAHTLTSTVRWCLAGELGLAEEVDALLAGFNLDDYPGVWPLVGHALSTAQARRIDEARAGLEVVAPRLPAAERDSEWLPMMAQVAELIGHVGAHPLAAWAYDALLPYRSRYAVEGIGAAVRGSVERDLGVLAATLGRRDQAVAHFDAARRANERLGASLLVARTLRDAGMALGDDACLQQARAAYQALGIFRRVAEIDARVPERAGRSPAAEPAFRRRGDVWELSYGGREVRLRDAKGLRDIASLLAEPGRPVPALELVAEGTSVEQQRPPDGLHQPGDLGEVVDARAREAYRRRLRELDQEINDADDAGDAGRSSRAAAERDALVAQLSAAYGLGRRPRRVGDPAERARSAVTARIHDAIRRIDTVHPELGLHLRRSVRTGRVCVYEPEVPTRWSL